MLCCPQLRTALILLLIALPFRGDAAIALAPSAQPSIPQATADQFMQQGWERYDKRQIEAAIALWQKAKQLYQAQGDLINQGTALFNITIAYLDIDHYRGAIAALKEFQTVASVQDRQTQGQALNNLGYAYAALGDETEAIAAYQAALRMMQDLNDKAWISKINLNLGNLYESLGNYEQAYDHFQTSLKLAQQTREPYAESRALSNIGQYYSLIGDYTAAIAHFERSLRISRAINKRDAQANTLINLGSAYQALQKPDRAIPLYEASLALSRVIKSRKNEADALQSLGLVYEDQKNYDKAIQFYQQSLAIAQSIGHTRTIAAIFNNLGHALYGAGRLNEAEQSLRQAVRVLDQLRTGLEDANQVSIFDTQTSYYNLLQQILAAANKPELALEATEQGRARAFSALLARRAPSTTPSTKVAIESPTLTLDQIKAFVQTQNITIVEYSLIPADEFVFRGKQTAPAEAILIWVIQPTGTVTLRRVNLKAQKQSLNQLVTLSRESIGVRHQGIRLKQTKGFILKQPQTKIDVATQLKQLHKLLIEPIQNFLPTDPDQRVVFIPQGDLFQVPFSALQDAAGHYLISKHTLLTAPSLQVLQFTHQRRQALLNVTGDTVIVGNPKMPQIITPSQKTPVQLSDLPGAKAEAETIAKLLNTQAFLGDRAKKADILPKLSNARLIHLATHGLLDDFKGLGVPGAIALAPSGTGELNDGLLTASEISDLKLKADLVVLSACDTGRGKISGDSVIGLSRSLISAGTPSVIVSLWSVPDAPTADLMTEFYRNLTIKKLDKARSLRQAMLNILRKPNYAHPKNWAAFTLIGEAD
jgi:CHAT domain-containing protein/tetratricopeptide (TPR) repeat protein